MPRVTKGDVVGAVLRGRPTYVRKLVDDLCYGRVLIPKRWLREGDAEIVGLDREAILDDQQQPRCNDFACRCRRLIDIVVVLVREYADEQNAARRLDRNDLDSLRRGRGPARVRDRLFETLDDWPDEATPGMRDDTRTALSASEADREAYRRARERTSAEMSDLLRPLWKRVQAAVREWAARRGLSPRAADEVLSDVVDQLDKSVALLGGSPTDVERWTMSTAKEKWQAARTTHSSGAQGSWQPEPPRRDDAVGDAAAEHVDLQRSLRAGVARLRELEDAYLGLEPPRHDAALTCRIAADLLVTGDVDRIIEIIDGTEKGIADVAAELYKHQREHSTARQAAIVRVIREQLGRVLHSSEAPPYAP
jgi:hypothetical protein